MSRFQNTTASFVPKPTSARWANQIISTNDLDYYRNSFDQRIGSSSSNIFRRTCCKEDREVYPFANESNQSNVPTEKLSLKALDIKAFLILSAVLHIITILTISSISVFLLINKNSTEIPRNPVIVEIPIGSVLLYSGNLSTLNGTTYRWLLCDGSAVSRSTYSDLFNVIGTTYGSGNSTDTFNLPDFRGRFPLGSNSSNTTQFVSGGNASHVITVNQMPSHAHGTGTLQIQSDGAHTHVIKDLGHNHGGKTVNGGSGGGNSYTSYYSNGIKVAVATSASHYHGIQTGLTGITIVSGGSHKHGIQGMIGSNGSNQAMDIMPPYQTIHYIIRT